jgi:hypothetical protein
MSDLISREDAIDAISKIPVKVDDLGYTWMIAIDVLNQIDGIPSAEPERTAKVEKIHMEYASEGDFDIYECGDCGNCGETVMRGDKFCHECGAKLEWE